MNIFLEICLSFLSQSPSHRQVWTVAVFCIFLETESAFVHSQFIYRAHNETSD